MTTDSPVSIWLDVVRYGIEIVAAGDRLRFRPKSAMSRQLLDRIKASKRQLMCLLTAATPTPQVFQELVAELVERVHQLWPSGYKLSEADWRELDMIEERLVKSKYAGSLPAIIAIAGEYERKIRKWLQRDRHLREGFT